MDPANLAKALRIQQTLKEAAQASNELIKIAHGELEEKKFELQRCKASLASVTEEKNRALEDCKEIQQQMRGVMQAAAMQAAADSKSELERFKRSLQRVTDEKKHLEKECDRIQDEIQD